MKSSRHRRLCQLALPAVLLLAGCAQDNGPIMGEWSGRTPGRDIDASKRVDLVLYGAPGAQSGQYHTASTESDPLLASGHGERQWGGTWERGRRMVDGREITTITLKDHLPDDIGGYVLEADGTLHVLDPNGIPDTTPAGRLYTLSPVSSGNRR